MFKYIFCVIFFLGQAGVSIAQSVQDTLLVVPGKENLYFYHVVTKGESLYSVARKYFLEPKVVADANKITTKTPLKLFQLLKIPLNQNNFVQSGNVSISQLTPLFHKVIKGETLYRVSQLHDKVDPELLKKWNHLKSNEVRNGQYLVVGWLKVGDENRTNTSPGNNSNNSDKSITQGKEDVRSAEVIAKDENSTKKTVSESKPLSEPEREQEAANPSSSVNSEGGSFLSEVIAAEKRNRNEETSVLAVNGKPEIKESETGGQTSLSAPKTNPALYVPPVSKKVERKVEHSRKETTPDIEKKTAEVIPEKEPVKEEKKKEDNPFSKMLDKVTHKPQTATSKPLTENHNPANNTTTVSEKNTTVEKPNEVGQPTSAESVAPSSIAPVTHMDSIQLVTSAKSEFEQQFEQQTDNGANVDSKKGAAGWFRSNVKTGSGRYYALCDELPRGTIVKVVNPISGKYVLAKVLDAIPKQKENYNLIIKLSDAAMNDLGTSQSRFWCEIRYAKGSKEK